MKKSTTKDGNEYELFVKSVYERLQAIEGVEGIVIQHDVDLKGAKGTHQIDLYWTFSMIGIQYKVVVECKNYKTRVSIDKIRAFHDTVEDIGGVKGVFVTTVGFQSGAIEYAKKCGISAVVIHQPSNKDWEGRIMQVGLNIKVPSIINKKKALTIDQEKGNVLGINLNTCSKDINTFSTKAKYDEMTVESIITEKSSNSLKDLNDDPQNNEENQQKTIIRTYYAREEKIIDILNNCPMDVQGHVDISINFRNCFMYDSSDDKQPLGIPVRKIDLSYDVIIDEWNYLIKADKDVLAILYDVTANKSVIIPHEKKI